MTSAPHNPTLGESAPLVSVVVVAYNARRHLPTCLVSLLALDYPSIEIVVVDNASTDGSADLVAADYPQVRLVRSRGNLGYAAGNNLGVAHARGQYIAILNPDTEVAPGWLSALVTALEADPQAGLATSKILLFDRRDTINTCGNDVHYTGLAFCRGLGRPAAEFSRREIVPAVSGAAFLIRRDLYDRLGGFDERFFMYLEDTDLSWRAALAGYSCLFVPESVVYHHYTTRVSAAKTFYLERNRYLLLLRAFRPTTLLLLLPALLLAEVVTWGYLVLSGPGHVWAKLRAYAWILRHAREIAADHRATQRSRNVADGAILRRRGHRLALEQVASGPRLRFARAVLEPPFQRWYRVATNQLES